jgi:hypothetical protein
MSSARRDAAQQIENQVPNVAGAILDVVDKDPQKPHTAEKLHPTAMQKNARQ